MRKPLFLRYCTEAEILCNTYVRYRSAGLSCLARILMPESMDENQEAGLGKRRARIEKGDASSP